MLLKCVAEVGADLGPYDQRGLFYTPKTRFDLTRGKIYRAYGLLMEKGGLAALTTDDYGKPFWYPLQAFTVEDSTLPDGWRFRFFSEAKPDGMPGDFQPQAIWGYPELVRDLAHNDALMDRDPDAMAIFAAEEERRAQEEDPDEGGPAI